MTETSKKYELVITENDLNYYFKTVGLSETHKNEITGQQIGLL